MVYGRNRYQIGFTLKNIAKMTFRSEQAFGNQILGEDSPSSVHVSLRLCVVDRLLHSSCPCEPPFALLE